MVISGAGAAGIATAKLLLAFGLENIINASSNLSRQAFLYLEPSRIRFYNAHQLAYAGQALIRKISQMNTTDYRRHMMLTMR